MHTLCEFIAKTADIHACTILVSNALIGESRKQEHGFTGFSRDRQGHSFQQRQIATVDGTLAARQDISSDFAVVVGAGFDGWNELRALMQRIGPDARGSVVILVPTGLDPMSQASLSQFTTEISIRTQAFGFSGAIRVSYQCDVAEIGAVTLEQPRFSTSLGKMLAGLTMSDGGRVACLTLDDWSIEPEQAKLREPMFTVLTRTQGKRMETLREVLLCISAQTVDDFEHLIIAHNATDVAVDEIRALIDEQSPSMRRRIRFEQVVGGNRTTPINIGFELARGKYVVMLDDDDIVFGHWLETFRGVAREKPGSMLRSVAVRQEFTWAYVDGRRSARAISAMHKDYASQFDYFRQLGVNQTPNLSIAFPRYLFSNHGMRFDETLTTTEDWDCIMRCASRVGVGSAEEITCIYRWWVNTETSMTVHSQSEWSENYCRIQEKMDAEVNLLDVGGVRRLREMMDKMDSYVRWAEKLHNDLTEVRLAVNADDVEQLKEKIATMSNDVQDGLSVISSDSPAEIMPVVLPHQDLLPQPRLSRWQKIFASPRKMARIHANLRRETIRKSGIFDSDWYLSTYPDVAEKKIDALTHFVQFGSRELRSPSAEFDARHYYVENADLRAQRVEPVFHFLLHGKREGRRYQGHM
ncbi:glycosyltransferase family 2 protein [Burkholderia gladioli]|uniref:glycosyltransferase family 2 protein n=1 Tax=Burkholderia gladioli TaxID=28095 RepID=UPI0016407376|nr:glycosyltransferase family A protein [Burkholderia gladioli]